MSISVKARFIGGDPLKNSVSTYTGEVLAERLEVTFNAPTVCVPMYRPGELALCAYSTKDPVGDETRRQFGGRLRRAAHEATRGVEEAILKALREQGHLV